MRDFLADYADLFMELSALFAKSARDLSKQSAIVLIFEEIIGF